MLIYNVPGPFSPQNNFSPVCYLWQTKPYLGNVFSTVSRLSGLEVLWVRVRGTLGSDCLPPPPARPMLAARATPEKVDMLNFCSTGEQKKGRDKARGEGWLSWKYFDTLEPSRSLGPLFSRREPLSFLFHPLTLHFIPPRSLSDHPGLTAEQAQASGRDKT